MSKLFKLRPCLSFEEAATLLGTLINEEVIYEDIYDLYYYEKIQVCIGGNLVGLPAWPPAPEDGWPLWRPVEDELDLPDELFANALQYPIGVVETTLGIAPINMVGRVAYIWFKLTDDYERPIVKNLHALDAINFEEDISVAPSEIIRVAQIANSLEELPNATKKTFETKAWSVSGRSLRVPQIIKPFEKQAETKNAGFEVGVAHEKPSTSLIIASLLDLLSSKKRALNQSAVISEILEKSPATRGLSKRNLESAFALANKASKSS